MEGLGVLLVVVAAFIANLPALREQWRTDAPVRSRRSGCSASVFSISDWGSSWCSCSSHEREGTEDKAPYLSGFIVGFILYGGLTLMRVVRYREPPAWLMHFGIADIVLLGAKLACLVAYLWA